MMPFLPSGAADVAPLLFVGTFAVAGLAVAAPWLIYESDAPLRFPTFAMTLALVWGGVLLSFIYPRYTFNQIWIALNMAYAALAAGLAVWAAARLGRRGVYLWPLTALAALSSALYLAQVSVAYFGVAVGAWTIYVPYVMLYLALAGLAGLMAMALAGLRPNLRIAVGYAASLLIGLGMAIPLYELTASNAFMQHIMDMVFAMGLGVVTTPSSIPLAAVFMGLYVAALLMLAVRSAAEGPFYGGAALAGLVYATSSFTNHSIPIYFASVIAASLALANLAEY